MKMQSNRLLIMILECEKLIKFLQNYFSEKIFAYSLAYIENY